MKIRFVNRMCFLSVIIEKLLRSTEVKRIYILIRPKKGVSIKDRIAAWDKDPVSSLTFQKYFLLQFSSQFSYFLYCLNQIPNFLSE